MIWNWHHGALRVISALCILLICGCGRETPSPDDFLVRIGDRGITVGDFQDALEIALTAYPHDAARDDAALREIKQNVLNDLIEELVLRLKAKELNIEVSKSELRAEIDAIRNDYPGDLFEKTFMENAISFEAWSKRLAARMLMEKVIKQAIDRNIALSDEEIAGYYREHFPDADPSKPPLANARDVILQRIRHDKAEAAYREWIRNVYSEYDQTVGIERNMEKWRKQLEG